MRFVAQAAGAGAADVRRPASQPRQVPALGLKADAIGQEIGAALHDPALGLAVWAAVHGLAMLVLENVIDLGQRRSGLHVLPAARRDHAAQPVFHKPRLAVHSSPFDRLRVRNFKKSSC